MLNAGMTLHIISNLHFRLTIPLATMRAGFPGWEPHLSAENVAYIAGDTRATVEVEFAEEPAASPAA